MGALLSYTTVLSLGFKELAIDTTIVNRKQTSIERRVIWPAYDSVIPCTKHVRSETCNKVAAPHH
jgi:hypothetical protein